MTREAGPSIAVVGVGGVGGYLGARLVSAGCDVRFLARGENLTALRRNGLRITNSVSGDWSVDKLRASDDPRDIGKVDFVFLCVKTWQLSAAIEALSSMVGEHTAVVTMQNGVEAPEQVAAQIGRGHVIPGNIRVVATAVGPGEVRHVGGPAALSFAELDGGASDRVMRLREVVRGASLTVLEPANIWVDLWAKFLLVVPIGSVGAATGGSDDRRAPVATWHPGNDHRRHARDL